MPGLVGFLDKYDASSDVPTPTSDYSFFLFTLADGFYYIDPDRTVIGPLGASSGISAHGHAGSTDGGLIRLDTITAPTDSTSLNASTDMHGLLPKLSGSSDEYFSGIGGWSEIPGATGLTEHTHTGSTDGGLLRLDTITAPTDSTSLDSSTDMHGLLPKLDGSSDNYMSGIGAWGGPILSGTYNPTLYHTTNVAASTDYTCWYIRIGNVVFVGGSVTIDTTTTGATELGISLPIASNLGAQDVGGVAGNLVNEVARIKADATNDRAVLNYTATSTASNYWTFTFSYRIN